MFLKASSVRYSVVLYKTTSRGLGDLESVSGRVVGWAVLGQKWSVCLHSPENEVQQKQWLIV